MTTPTTRPAPTPLPHRALIVGGGLAGLAAAVELAARGLRVTLVEANPHLGGKMNVAHADGFTFDMGPTIITLPQVFRGILQRAGRDPADHCQLVDLDPQWRCHFEDGAVVDLRRDPQLFARQIDAQFPIHKPGDGYLRFLDWSRRMFRLSEKVFFYKDLGGIADMLRTPPAEPGVLADAAAMRPHSTVGRTIHRFINEPHIRQIAEHFLQYVGSSPFLAPAILGLIAAAQNDHGCWYPMAKDGASPGGTRLIARTLAQVAADLGVELILSARVARIDTTQDRRVTGVTLEDGRQIAADSVISNADVQRTHRHLLDHPAAERRARRLASTYKPACSGLVLYLGLRAPYEHLAHHNFLFSSNSHAEFNDIYNLGLPARDPTLYIAAPSRTDPAQAPLFNGAPGEALYVLIHTAHRRPGQRWGSPGDGGLLDQYRPVVIDKMKRMGMPDIEDRIAVERALTPDGIERLYNAEGGAIYGLASHGLLAGGFKPRNRSREFKGLYFAGGSANPGPGVPMVLMSGVTAAHALLNDLGLDTQHQDLSAAEPKALPRGSRRQPYAGPPPRRPTAPTAPTAPA